MTQSASFAIREAKHSASKSFPQKSQKHIPTGCSERITQSRYRIGLRRISLRTETPDDHTRTSGRSAESLYQSRVSHLRSALVSRCSQILSTIGNQAYIYTVLLLRLNFAGK